MDIQYYKTYEVTVKISTEIADVTTTTFAWPSRNDDGEIIWTWCEDNITIIPNEYIANYKLYEIQSRR